MIADDLFAGAGGWDLAAASLGIHARGVENMPAARATRAAAGLTTVHDDVWTFRPDDTAQGLIASPPCQTFSQAGSGSGRKALDQVLSAIESDAHSSLDRLRDFGKTVGDERTGLVLTPLHFATQHPYQWLAWEQVPAVLPVWEACAVVLRELGWKVWTGMVHAEQYGVPQTRKRALLLGSLAHDVDHPAPTHSRFHSRTPERIDEGMQRWVSMAEALTFGLTRRPSPTVTGGGTETGGAEPIAKLARYTGRDDWQPRWVPTFNDQSGTPFDHDWPSKRPATVVAGRDIVQNPGATANRFNGSTKSRNDGVRVTVPEAAVLQSFPADHPFQGNQGKQYLQVGNAIPPGMAAPALAVSAGLVEMAPKPEVVAHIDGQLSLFDDEAVSA